MRQRDLKGEGLEWQGSFPLLIHLLIWDDRNRNGVLVSGSKGFFRTSRKQGSWCKGSYRAHHLKSLKFGPSWDFLCKTKREAYLDWHCRGMQKGGKAQQKAKPRGLYTSISESVTCGVDWSPDVLIQVWYSPSLTSCSCRNSTLRDKSLWGQLLFLPFRNARSQMETFLPSFPLERSLQFCSPFGSKPVGASANMILSPRLTRSGGLKLLVLFLVLL